MRSSLAVRRLSQNRSIMIQSIPFLLRQLASSFIAMISHLQGLNSSDIVPNFSVGKSGQDAREMRKRLCRLRTNLRKIGARDLRKGAFGRKPSSVSVPVDPSVGGSPLGIRRMTFAPMVEWIDVCGWSIAPAVAFSREPIVWYSISTLSVTNQRFVSV